MFVQVHPEYIRIQPESVGGFGYRLFQGFQHLNRAGIFGGRGFEAGPGLRDSGLHAFSALHAQLFRNMGAPDVRRGFTAPAEGPRHRHTARDTGIRLAAPAEGSRHRHTAHGTGIRLAATPSHPPPHENRCLIRPTENRCLARLRETGALKTGGRRAVAAETLEAGAECVERRVRRAAGAYAGESPSSTACHGCKFQCRMIPFFRFGICIHGNPMQ